jgi:hypothetical protein
MQTAAARTRHRSSPLNFHRAARLVGPSFLSVKIDAILVPPRLQDAFPRSHLKSFEALSTVVFAFVTAKITIFDIIH